tara:strand:- start:4655 stop:5119 length:465 start_codon:yes stop_codon:yes gene_type:complete
MDKRLNPIEACNLVFVYGTLKKGFNNHHLLQIDDSIFKGHCTTGDKYHMFVEHSIPFVIRATDEDQQDAVKIEGELYEVNADTLQDLDELEGHPRFYRRQLVSVLVKESKVKKAKLAWMYIYPNMRIYNRNKTFTTWERTGNYQKKNYYNEPSL